MIVFETKLACGGRLVQRDVYPDPKLTEEVLSFCKHVAGSCHIVACFTRSDYASASPTTKKVLQVLVILRGFQPRLMSYVRIVRTSYVTISAVDKWVFERDVDKGLLGEALASALTFPYTSLVNEAYVHLQEVKLKKRLIVELLQSLVLDFPQLSYELYLKPEYFMYETMLTRGRLFPPTMYALVGLLGKREDETRMERSLCGFMEALKELEEENVVYYSKEYVRISKKFVDDSKSRRRRFTNLFKTGQRTLFSSLLGLFPQIMNALSKNRELFSNIQRAFNEDSRIAQGFDDPENYVYVPTATGLVPLANRLDIKVVARKVFSTDKDAEVRIESIGGILNDVYLVKAVVKGKPRKVVVKRFRDWSNFKWFPLTLWSVGTRTFAVSGSSRLERECAISRLLDSNGFAVPKVLHVSRGDRLIVMEYLEGEDVRRVVKRVASSKNSDEITKNLDVISRVGRTLAGVHALGIALGDTKPENILVGKEGRIYLMDFEQASRKGDEVWDLAEFLYYAGHDISPFVEVGRLEKFAETFIMGYLEGGGNVHAVKKAGNPKYTKVFSIFAFPHIMFILSSVCRKADKLKTTDGQM
jgi:tRNA A-37 threonylcarbamoyl transferase component Bud32